MKSEKPLSAPAPFAKPATAAAQLEIVYRTEGGAAQSFSLTAGAQSLDGSGRYVRLGGDSTIYEMTADSRTDLLAIAAGGLEG